MSDSKAGASLYILTVLLQRLEKRNPGLIKDIVEGVKSDQLSIPKGLPEKKHIDEIFKEALATLERADKLLDSCDNS